MMAMQVAPAQLFYDFCLDDHVPADHLLRRIDRFLDLESVRTALKPFYSTIGRPSVDPELMMRILIVGYATNYLIDTQHAVILDVEATRAIRQGEVGASRTMLERTAERFGLKPQHLAADSAYGSAENLAWLVKEKQIAPHIPVIDKVDRTGGTFSRSDFVFDPDQDHYTCPDGKRLVQYRRSCNTPYRDHQGWRSVLLGQAVRLSEMCPKVSLLPPRPRGVAFHATWMRMPGMWPVLWPARPPSSARVVPARRARCCLPTSTHLEAGTPEITRAERSQRRVSSGGYGSEPETTRQAAAHAHLRRGRSMTMCVQPTRTWRQSRNDRAGTATRSSEKLGVDRLPSLPAT